MKDQGTDFIHKNENAEVFFLSVKDDIEASIVEAKLRASGIPTIKRYREAGGYLEIYMGMNSFGVDLYVPRHLLEEAQVVYSLTDGVMLEEESATTEEIEKPKVGAKKRVIILFLIWFAQTALWFLIQGVLKIIDFLK